MFEDVGLCFGGDEGMITALWDLCIPTDFMHYRGTEAGRRCCKHWSRNSSVVHTEDHGETNCPPVTHEVLLHACNNIYLFWNEAASYLSGEYS